MYPFYRLGPEAGIPQYWIYIYNTHKKKGKYILRISTRDPMNRIQDRSSLCCWNSFCEKFFIALFALLDFSPYIYASFLSQVFFCAGSSEQNAAALVIALLHYFSHLFSMLVLKWWERLFFFLILFQVLPKKLLIFPLQIFVLEFCWFLISRKAEFGIGDNNLFAFISNMQSSVLSPL